MPYTP